MTKTIAIPSWIMEALKYAGAVVVALGIGYARFVGVERDVADLKSRSSVITSKIDDLRDYNTQIAVRQSTIELKQNVLEKSITDSLSRIESSVKDVRIEIKELQKQSK